jgi:hypothetical protein
MSRIVRQRTRDMRLLSSTILVHCDTNPAHLRICNGNAFLQNMLRCIAAVAEQQHKMLHLLIDKNTVAKNSRLREKRERERERERDRQSDTEEDKVEGKKTENFLCFPIVFGHRKWRLTESSSCFKYAEKEEDIVLRSHFKFSSDSQN